MSAYRSPGRRSEHVWRSKFDSSRDIASANPGGGLDDLLGYVAPFRWECEECGTGDPSTVCAEVIVEWVHSR